MFTAFRATTGEGARLNYVGRLRQMGCATLALGKTLLRDSRGFILLQTVVASIIFALVGTAVLAGLSTMLYLRGLTEEQSIAENVARNQMEYIFTQAYREPLQTPYPAIAVPAGYSVSYSVAYADTVNPDPEAERLTVTTVHDGKNVLTLETVRGRTDGLQLRVSEDDYRNDATRLIGGDVSGTVYVFLDDPDSLVAGPVEFYLDGFGPLHTENHFHWDFMGSGDATAVSPANPWSTLAHANGTHRILARTQLTSGNIINVSADFTISN